MKHMSCVEKFPKELLLLIIDSKITENSPIGRTNEHSSSFEKVAMEVGQSGHFVGK